MAERLLWDVYAKGNMYDTVIEKYQKMAEADPKDVKAHEYLAKAYEGKGDNTSAIEEYEKLVKIQPDNRQWYITIANLYQKPEIKNLFTDSVLELDGNRKLSGGYQQ